MDGYVVAGCASLILLFVLIAWRVYHKRRRPQLLSTVVIAESMQPQVICRSVPCQHPYYRVISEYSGADVVQELMPQTKETEEERKSPTKFDYKEWSRSLSLSSIPRKTCHPCPSSRRSSTSDLVRSLSFPIKHKHAYSNDK